MDVIADERLGMEDCASEQGSRTEQAVVTVQEHAEVQALLQELVNEQNEAMSNINSPEEMVGVISSILKRQDALMEAVSKLGNCNLDSDTAEDGDVDPAVLSTPPESQGCRPLRPALWRTLLAWRAIHQSTCPISALSLCLLTLFPSAPRAVSLQDLETMLNLLQRKQMRLSNRVQLLRKPAFPAKVIFCQF